MSENKATINWFPGHMTKAKRKIAEQIKLVDAVAEIVDARIPVSSRNPDLPELIGGKPHIVLLNKCDMADSDKTAQWVSFYKKNNVTALPLDCKSGKGIGEFKNAVMIELGSLLKKYEEKGMAGKPLRVMVVGIPNVGKSSFINRIAGRSKAKVENRPGVTRGNQWFTVDKRLELLDTPGVLWPKFESQTVGEHLAMTGAVTDRILDTELLAMRLIAILKKDYMPMLAARYGVEELPEDDYDAVCVIGKKRGMVIRGGETDTLRAANMLLEEFRNCKIGRITLEGTDFSA
ncbi:MAG: ribosome biogenesis GTPase YlqF [Clostridia bacterium]|nr:ribosome biogenesis GTPase YlqF [Clostridia bacterium]